MSRLLLHLKVWRALWSASWAAETEYRLNFLFAAFASLGGLFGSAFSLWLFYRSGGGFPGWSIDHCAVVLGLFSIYTGLVSSVLAPNLSKIAQHVSAGTLEFVLLKPVDAQFLVSLRGFSPWGAPDVFFGTAIVGGALVRVDAAFVDVVAGVVPVVAGVVLLYSLWFMVATTSIWFVRTYNATEVLRGLLDAGRFPMAAYPAAYRLVFTFVVPVAFLTTVPAETFLGRSEASWVLGSVGVAAGAFLASRLLWRWALRSYTGASS